MDKQKIERPVEVKKLEYDAGFPTQFVLYDARGLELFGVEERYAQQIVDALNQTAEGSWAWVSREMRENYLQPFTHGYGRHHYRHNWEKFEISNEEHTEWRDVELITGMTTATDWRRA